MTDSTEWVASGDRTERPRIGTIRTRTELGALLTELRRRSGHSLRKLAAEVGSSASISGWCRAENLPFPSQYDVFAAMLEQLGVEDPAPWLELVDDLRTTGTTNGGDHPPSRPGAVPRAGRRPVLRAHQSSGTRNAASRRCAPR